MMAEMRPVVPVRSEPTTNGSQDPAIQLTFHELTKNRSSMCVDGTCNLCRRDQAFLRRKKKPILHKPAGVIHAVDLFAGAGGMTVGLEESARSFGMGLEVALAVESDADVAAVYGLNQPKALVRTADLTSLFNGAPGSPATSIERKLAEEVGSCHILLGGPPCQGHSDLNNHTRRQDPKNALYLLMARAAEILRPDIVVIENVGPVQWDKGNVVSQARKALEGEGYAVAGQVIDLCRVGVPQRRRRYLLIGSKHESVVPHNVLFNLAAAFDGHPDRDLRWAIGDLKYRSDTTTFDSPSNPTATNIKRIDYLFDNDIWDLPNAKRPDCHKDKKHSYVSMYGRLHWSEPAQTITTGFGSMGQGRYVHPSRRRTITPHEAARIQTFPDWFDFGKDTRRGVLAKVIGNAVPPLLMIRLGSLIIPAIKASMTSSQPILESVRGTKSKLE